jgi:PD-(D/E)XK nuclease superfamily
VARRVVRDGTGEATLGPQARRSASGLSGQRPAADLAGPTPALPWRERWLEDAVLGRKGRPDLVERDGGVLTVADFKTGQGDMTDDRRDQLLIYAALVRSSLGELPARAEIRRPDGRTQGLVSGVRTSTTWCGVRRPRGRC